MATRKTHVVVTPFPAQGHIGPLMKLAYKIASNGIKVTFVTTDYMHHKIMSSLPPKLHDSVSIPVSLVPISTNYNEEKDGLELIKSVFSSMPCDLEKLIEKINRENEDEPVSCVVADISVWWAIEVAKKMGIKGAAVVPYGAANLAFDLNAPNLVDSGIIDCDGFPLKDELIYLSNETLPWSINELTWRWPDVGTESEKFGFKSIILKYTNAVKNSDWVLVNSFYELEKWAYDLIPKAKPIGPLTISDEESFIGNVWQEDSTCLKWLDQQPTNSVIYVAFGSMTSCKQSQFHELAHGLELMGQPFLWVVRPDFIETAEFPVGFIERVANLGKIVEWAPQEKVLAHPSVLCFFSHCGWNSIIEGVGKGVPFLCWPSGCDQMHNSRVICESWKIGFRVFLDENGTVTRREIKSKIENLVCSQEIRANALKLREMATESIAEGGYSFNNFMAFLQGLKR